MPYPALAVAYAFVKKGIEEEIPFTQMKLQKLVFFAHGLYLATESSQPLIKENFQAWKFGPVVPEIYHTYKYYGDEKINDTFWLFGAEDSWDETLKNADKKSQEAIDATWSALKSMSAIKLSNWTHKEGSPWQKVYKPGIHSVEIPNEKIEAYFKRNVIKTTNGTGEES
jgi:uncharacterized phage-associated protein